MDETDSDRRRFLRYAGTGMAVAIGGCLGRSEEAPASTAPTDASTETETETTTETETETETETTTETDTETTTEQETQEPTMSTVFHFSGAPSVQNHAVANVSNLRDDESVDLGTIALVANGTGIKLLVEDDSTVADGVRSLIDDGIEFYACHNSMQAFGVDKSDLLAPEIEVVPSGVGTLTKLQAEGYAYIKTP